MVIRSLKEKMTPYEKWYDRKTNLAHLRCMAYAYVLDNNRRGKLSKKDEKLRFIGYSHQTKGYRLIDENHIKSHHAPRFLSYSMNLTSIRMEVLVVVSIVLMMMCFLMKSWFHNHPMS